jgi:hypothetical protein
MKFKSAIALLSLPCLDSPIKVRQQCKKLGFKFLFSGAFKWVYYHLDFPEYVFKVWKDENDRDVDCFKTARASISPKFQKYFLWPIYERKFFFVQIKANGIGGSSAKALKEIEFFCEENGYNLIDDIRRSNVRFHDGKPVIIDFCE